MLDRYTAVIQAGGKGTRLKALTQDRIPKPLLRINGKPMIEWQIENIRKYGVRDFIIIVGHLGSRIQDCFGDGSDFGVRIRYVEENEPMGSAGALFYIREMSGHKDIILAFGDVMFDINLERLIHFYESRSAEAVLVVHPNDHPHDSDLVIMDEDNRVIGFDAKTNIRDHWYGNCVNAGLFVLSEKILRSISEPERYDLERDVLIPHMDGGKIFGYHTTEYLKDAGTVQRFYNVCEDQSAGLWERRNLGRRQKCIFLDRDGTLNVYRGLIYEDSQLSLEQGAAEAVRRINRSGYLAIAVTNQPVVARGLCSMEDVRRINRKLEVLLGEQGAYLDDLVFCPHHPDKGFPEENALYKVPCGCRKPKTGMIDEMVKKYNIDVSRSYIVGDSTVDIQTGIDAGLRTVLVKTGQAGSDRKYDVRADREAENLQEAVRLILSEREEA